MLCAVIFYGAVRCSDRDLIRFAPVCDRERAEGDGDLIVVRRRAFI